MYEPKTKPTAVTPAEYLATLPEGRRREEAEHILAIITKELGVEPVMWGPSMIGWGTVHYTYASGHEGDTAKFAFAPRASAISIYGFLGNPRSEELLPELGKFTHGKSCLYIKKLADVDEEVFLALAKDGYDNAEAYYAQTGY